MGELAAPIFEQGTANFFALGSQGTREMSAMVLYLSLMSLILGTSFACAAPRVPAHSVRLEQWGGTLFVCGLTLLGATLQRFC
jgi:hypothetical protein